jgi:hypothetical protein
VPKLFAALLTLALSATSFAGPLESAVQVQWMVKKPDQFGKPTPNLQYGSGVVLNGKDRKKLVLTNWHVCPGAGDGVRVVHADRLYKAKWLGADDQADLALLEVDANLPALPLAEEPVPAGTKVEQYGYGGAWEMSHKTGKVIEGKGVFSRKVADGGYKQGAPTFLHNGELFYQSGGSSRDMDLVPEGGDSGSAVVHDGKVVGLTWGSNRVDHGTFVSLEDIRRFLAPHLPTK